MRFRAKAAVWLAATGLIGGLVGCAGPGEPAGGATITREYGVAGGTFSSGGGLYLAVALREIDGKIGVCGGWAHDIQSVLSYRYNEHVLDSGSVSAGGRVLVQDLTFMARHPVGARLLGRQAACVRTAQAWPPQGDPVVRLPTRIFAVDADKGASAGTRFRQTGVVADAVL